jgi:hypothetical protein
MLIFVRHIYETRSVCGERWSLGSAYEHFISLYLGFPCVKILGGTGDHYLALFSYVRETARQIGCSRVSCKGVRVLLRSDRETVRETAASVSKAGWLAAGKLCVSS